jgi:hypothetical protein
MLEWSNNEAASQCISQLGFQYTNGALIREGFDPLAGLLLWLGALYPRQNTLLGSPPVTGSPQGTTADAQLLLLGALEAGALISTDATNDIVGFLTRSLPRGGTFMAQAFATTTPAIVSTIQYGKDGRGTVTDVYSDIDVVTKPSGQRYAAAIVGAAWSAFVPLAIALDASM